MRPANPPPWFWADETCRAGVVAHIDDPARADRQRLLRAVLCIDRINDAVPVYRIRGGGCGRRRGRGRRHGRFGGCCAKCRGGSHGKGARAARRNIAGNAASRNHSDRIERSSQICNQIVGIFDATEIRIKPSVMPRRSRVCLITPEWVVLAGWNQSLRAARLTASLITCNASSSRNASASPPLTEKPKSSRALACLRNTPKRGSSGARKPR